MQGSATVVLIAALVIMGVSALVLWRYTKDLHRARAAACRGGAIANTTAGPIEYAEKGAGFPVLSIHGAGGGYDQGLANAADLMGEGFRVIAPSRFGYLRTPVPQDFSPAAQADAHAALLSELGVSKAIALGVSAGARSAIELALRHPSQVAALILIVPATYSPTTPVAVDPSRMSAFTLWIVSTGADFFWWAAQRTAPSALVRFLGVPPKLVAASPRAEQDRVLGIIGSVEPLSLRFRGINIDSSIEPRPSPLDRISAPTLVITARDDLFNTLPAAEFAASGIRDAELVVYETGGHLLIGREMEVRDVVHDFLARARLGHLHPAAPWSM